MWLLALSEGITLAPRLALRAAPWRPTSKRRWDAAADVYEKGGAVVNDRLGGLRPTVDATTTSCAPRSIWPASAWTSWRSTLSDNVATAADAVTATATAVADKVGAFRRSATEAVDVHVEEAAEAEPEQDGADEDAEA